jgi:flagellar basal body-associated protein FliL
MHKEQQRHQHLKSNNIISKLAIIVLSIVLLTGISLVPALQIRVNGQVQQQQPQQQNQVGLSQVIKQIAQQVANANPGTNSTHVYQILVQLAKQTAQTSSQGEAIKEIRQISSQVTAYPFGTLSQVLSYFAQQIASGNSNVVQIVQQTIQEKASSISKNIT